MKKHPNPFKDCKNVKEVLRVIREKCEDLRGAPFRYFGHSNPHVHSGTLHFDLEADYTAVRRKGDSYDTTVGWYDLLLGERYDHWPGNTKLGRYRGEPFEDWISGGGGGSGSRNWTNHTYVRIKLTHVPHIKKLYEQNERRTQGLKKIRNTPYRYTEKDREVMAAAAALQKKVDDYFETAQRNYVTKYPQVSLMTGKPVRES